MATLSFHQNWPELFGFLLLIIGFVLAIFATSAVVSYIIIFLAGALFGRVWFMTRKSLKFSFFVLIIGFLFGYLIGSVLLRYGSQGIMVIFFTLGWVATYYLHVRGLISSRDF